MSKIVITGATSFIGEQLIKASIHKKWEVAAVVRRNSVKAKRLQHISNISVIESDMKEFNSIGNLVGKADYFVHLAWEGVRGLCRMDAEIQQKNLYYSLKAINSMIEVGCKQIIIAGSQAEYGSHKELIHEGTLCKPNTEYGKYKLELFKTASRLCELNGVRYKEPRIFSLYGQGDYESSFIMSLIKKMRKNEPCDMTECIQRWDYLYIDDAVDAILALCECDCPNGAYNLASGDCRTLKDYVEELYSILNSKSKLCYGAIPYPSTGMVSIQASIEKIRSKTNWAAQIKFEEGINRIIRFLDKSSEC